MMNCFFRIAKISLLAVIILSSKLYSQTNGFLSMEYQTGITLDKIDKVGDTLIFKQLCTTEIDSVINSGVISFKDSEIYGFQKAYFTMIVENNILQQEIVKFKKAETKTILTNLISQYGNDYLFIPKNILNDNYSLYKWSVISKHTKKPVTVEFRVKNKRKMTIWVYTEESKNKFKTIKK